MGRDGNSDRENREGINMLAGKIAVVTGASRGIGRAIALRFAKEGAHVIVNYNGSEERAESVKEEIEKAGGSAKISKCDVSDFEKCESWIQSIIEEYGKIDILVNNAGITRDNLLMRMSEEEFDKVISVNLKGTFNCMKQAARPMMKQKYGKIINMASVVGVTGNAGQVNYAASKAGVIGMTKSMAKELANRGVTVNAIAPGFIRTAMTDVLSDDVKAEITRVIPMGVMGETEDVANLAAFLASDASRYITGQVINVDGGMVM